ncbi:hypothetical protein BBJ28_00012183 [Nothophytophthora sp. Chile5]|nr:hypothetical protein BBJ28_00012183 [Nothophytophthora sp. Chile5]
MAAISGYEALSLLGSGQFGDVLLVRRVADRKLFAAKVPHGDDDAARQTSRLEAQLLTRLRHANIVQCIETVEDGRQLAIVMEYTSGGDLDGFLRSHQDSRSCSSYRWTNILLDGDGIVKLSDFGVAKVLQNPLDAAHTVTGTPHYMAPELLEGNAYDSKSDVWSLGCVLYELATYSPPFPGTALGTVVYQILHNEPAAVPTLYSAAFQALVTNLLQKQPQVRHLVESASRYNNQLPDLGPLNFQVQRYRFQPVHPAPISTRHATQTFSYPSLLVPFAEKEQCPLRFAEQCHYTHHQIVAIGKNYEAHAREMGAAAAPKDPVVFLKPTSSYVRNGGSVLLPPGIGEVHHEVELGVVIGKGGKDIAESDSMDHVAGYLMYLTVAVICWLPDCAFQALAIDMTARDLQAKAKKAGLPWTHAKGLDTFTPISDFIPKSAVPSPHELNLWLKVDDELRQNGSTSDMVHSIPFLIAYVSRIMTLEEGDLLITGTPSGVGPVPPNSVRFASSVRRIGFLTITAGITGLIDVRFPVETRVYKS